MKINFSNLEELVFEKQDLVKKLPHRIFDYHQLWLMGKRHVFMKVMAKTAILDALSELQNADCIDVLQEYYKQSVSVERISHRTTEHLKIPISESDICDKIWNITEFNNYFMWRDADYLYISFWR